MRTKQIECIVFRKKEGSFEFLLLKRIPEKGGFCHYEEKYDKEILKIIEETDMEIIGLPEGTGIYLKNSSNKIIGTNSAYFFSKSGNKKELKIGKIYKYFFYKTNCPL